MDTKPKLLKSFYRNFNNFARSSAYFFCCLVSQLTWRISGRWWQTYRLFSCWPPHSQPSPRPPWWPPCSPTTSWPSPSARWKTEKPQVFEQHVQNGLNESNWLALCWEEWSQQVPSRPTLLQDVIAFRTSSSYFLQEPKAFLQFLTAVDTSEPIAFKKRWEWNGKKRKKQTEKSHTSPSRNSKSSFKVWFFQQSQPGWSCFFLQFITSLVGSRYIIYI